MWEQGDEESFAILYERYREPLSRYCRSIVRDSEDARDAQQSAMMAALRALRSRPLDGRVKPWLYRIAHNEAISVLRRRRPTEQLDDATPARVAPDQLETWESLLLDLRSLPERQRAALLLRELAGLDYDEIAVALSGTPVAARKSVFEARAALAETAAGRTTACEDIRRRISDCDGRVLRARRVRGHLDSCAPCAAFADSVRDRRRVLGTIPVLPLSALGLLGGGGAAGIAGTGMAGGVAGTSLAGGVAGVAAGGGATGALAIKGIALCALCAIAGTGVVLGDHGGRSISHAQATRPALGAGARAHGTVHRAHPALRSAPAQPAQHHQTHAVALGRSVRVHASAQVAPVAPDGLHRVLAVAPRRTPAAARTVPNPPAGTAAPTAAAPAPSSAGTTSSTSGTAGAPTHAAPLAGLESALVSAVLARVQSAGLGDAEQQAAAALAAGGASVSAVRQASAWLSGLLADSGLGALGLGMTQMGARTTTTAVTATTVTATGTPAPISPLLTLLKKFL